MSSESATAGIGEVSIAIVTERLKATEILAS